MKNLQAYPLIVVFTGGLVFLAWNFLQYANLYIQARDGIWYEEKAAKMIFLAARSERADVVFVGSSRTMNQIDTAYLGELGMDSFNFGLAGRWWQEYPSLVRSAAENAEKAVVVSIPIEELYRQAQCPRQFTLADVVVFTRNRQLFSCGEFRIADVLIANLPMNRFKTFIDRRVTSVRDTEKKIDYIKARYGYDLRGDGRQINYIRGKKDRYTALFRNGDGIVFSDRLDGVAFKPRIHDLRTRSFDSQALQYMQLLTRIITSNGKAAVFIIEPSVWNVRYKINQAGLAAAAEPAHILFNAGMEFDAEYWSDRGHLDYRGVKIYTKHLYGQLRELLK